MTNHHAAPTQAGPAPSAKQQAYIRKLALERGISFTPPHTIGEASRLIRDLKQRRPDAGSDQRRETRAVQPDMAQRNDDATRGRDDETTGHGSTATWSGSARETAPATATGERATNPPVEIARYRTPDGERLIQGQRILGVVRLIDAPATESGRRYLIERDIACRAEVAAIVADYLQQAETLQAIPAAQDKRSAS